VKAPEYKNLETDAIACTCRAVFVRRKDTAAWLTNGLPSIENDDDVAARKLSAAGALA